MGINRLEGETPEPRIIEEKIRIGKGEGQF